MAIHAKAEQSQLDSQGDKTWYISPPSPSIKSDITAIRHYPGNHNIPPASNGPTQSSSSQQGPVVNSLEERTSGCEPQVNQPQQPQPQTILGLSNDQPISDHTKDLSELQTPVDLTPTPSPRPISSGRRTPAKTAPRNSRVRKSRFHTVHESRRPSASDKKRLTNLSHFKRSESAFSSPSSSSSSLTDLASSPRPPRSRRRLRIEETEHLLNYFEKSEKPTSKERAAIAARLKLDSRTIQVWFQNRRAKLKRDDCLANHLMGEGEEKSKGRAKDDLIDRDIEGDSEIECLNINIDTMNMDGSMATAGSFVQAQPSAHLGSGPGTFLGYERSYGDAGWNQLFESELAQLPNLDDLQLATSLAGSEAFPDMHAAIDHFDMSTMDLVFGLDYETELPVHNIDPERPYVEARRLFGGEAPSDPLASSQERVHRHPHRQATFGSKHDPAGSVLNPPMRKASVMARLHSQIPVQQMGFTLVTDPSHAA